MMTTTELRATTHHTSLCPVLTCRNPPFVLLGRVTGRIANAVYAKSIGSLTYLSRPNRNLVSRGNPPRAALLRRIPTLHYRSRLLVKCLFRLPCLSFFPSVVVRVCPPRLLCSCRLSCRSCSPLSCRKSLTSSCDYIRSSISSCALPLQRRSSRIGASSLQTTVLHRCRPNCLPPRCTHQLLVKSITSTSRALANRTCSLRRRSMICP